MLFQVPYQTAIEPPLELQIQYQGERHRDEHGYSNIQILEYNAFSLSQMFFFCIFIRSPLGDPNKFEYLFAYLIGIQIWMYICLHQFYDIGLLLFSPVLTYFTNPGE